MYSQNINSLPSNTMLTQNPYNNLSYINYQGQRTYSVDQSQQPNSYQPIQHQPEQLNPIQNQNQNQGQTQTQYPQHQVQPQYQQQLPRHYQVQHTYHQIPPQQIHQLPPQQQQQLPHQIPQHIPHPHSQPQQFQQSQVISNNQQYYHPVVQAQPPQQIVNDPAAVSKSYTPTHSTPLIKSPAAANNTANLTVSSIDTSNIDQNSDISSIQTNLSRDEIKQLNSSLSINSHPNTRSNSNENFARILKPSSSSSKITKKQLNRVDSNSSTITKSSTPISNNYVPADPNLDISNFTEEDIIILKNMLPAAEVYKWKHAANRLSKLRSKKHNSEFCINKFHSMFSLPFNPKKSLLQSLYLIKADDKDQQQQKLQENYEGMVGSSLPYIVSKDGWNSIDN